MARLADCAVKQQTAGAWRSVDIDKDRYVYHYSTCMLGFPIDYEGNFTGEWDLVNVNLGHGSVSDQNGMNQLFSRAGIPMRYRRDSRGGGPRIELVGVKY